MGLGRDIGTSLLRRLVLWLASILQQRPIDALSSKNVQSQDKSVYEKARRAISMVQLNGLLEPSARVATSQIGRKCLPLLSEKACQDETAHQY